MRIGNGLVERTIRQGNYKRIPAPRDQNPMLVAAFSFAPLLGADGTSTDRRRQRLGGGALQRQHRPAVATVADGVVVDCLGASVAATTQSRNRFAVRVDGEGRPWLSCSTDGGTTWAP